MIISNCPRKNNFYFQFQGHVAILELSCCDFQTPCVCPYMLRESHMTVVSWIG